MNWRRGFWRLWIAASVLWISFWIWRRDLPCTLGFNYFGAKWWCSDQFVAPPEGYFLGWPQDTFPLMFGVPLMALVLGCILVWIVTGFRPGQNSN